MAVMQPVYTYNTLGPVGEKRGKGKEYINIKTANTAIVQWPHYEPFYGSRNCNVPSYRGFPPDSLANAGLLRNLQEEE